MKINSKIKSIIQEHYEGTKRISELQQEIRELEMTKYSLEQGLEKAICDLNSSEDVFDSNFAIGTDEYMAIIDFCEHSLSRQGIFYHPVATEI